MAGRKPKFEPGDIVRLKSGSPDMTIQEPLTDVMGAGFSGNYSCQWFAGSKLQHGRFAEESLESVTDE